MEHSELKGDQQVEQQEQIEQLDPVMAPEEWPENEDPKEPTVQRASLRGVVGQDLSYTVCIVNDENVTDDQTFTTDKALTFASIDQAIAGLQSLLDHAKAIQHQATLNQAYQSGFEAAQQQIQALAADEKCAEPCLAVMDSALNGEISAEKDTSQ